MNILADRRIRTALIAMLLDLMLTSARIGLAMITGSSALLADAYHSVSDLSLSVIFLACMVFRFIQEKKGCIDRIEKSRKIESIVVIWVSFFILSLPFQIFRDAHRLSSESITNIWVGIIGVVGIMACVFFMARLKLYVGRQTESISLEADGYHSLVDLFTSLLVLISLTGLMIGINMDEIVAVLIALLIASSGIELLISGIRSLVKGGEFEQFNLRQLLFEVVKKLPIGNVGKQLASYSWKRLKSNIRILSSIIIAAYLITGFVRVPLGHTAIRQVISRTIDNDLIPGLHYALPYPFGEIILVPEGDVRSVTIGSNRSGYTRSNGRNLWFEIVDSRAHRDNTDYLLTGDENLIYLKLTLQYRVHNAAEIFHDYQDLDDLVSHFAEYALWQQTAVTHYDDLLKTSHRHFSRVMEDTVHKEMAGLGISVEIVNITIQNIQPPASLVAVYRDVLNAHQQSQDLVNQAIAQRLHTLPVTRAEIITSMADINAASTEHILQAEGEIYRFSPVADVFRQSPQALQFERQKEAWVSGLKERQLTIADPRFDKHDYRVWAAPLAPSTNIPADRVN